MEKCILEENGGYSFIKYIPNFLNNEQKQSILKELLNEKYIGGTTNYGSEIPRVQNGCIMIINLFLIYGNFNMNVGNHNLIR